jgi:hypothetical protein
MNAKFIVSINSGAALLIYIAGFFILTIMAGLMPAVERVYTVALTGWTGAVSFFWLKRNSNNKITLEADKAGLLNGNTPK